MTETSLFQRLKASVTSFQKEEDGILTIFGVGIFILMMLAGGVALDFMRFESERAKLQNTLDRAVLAAASLSQERDRREVIEDYFRAAGLAGYDLNIDIEETLGSRTVNATSSAPVRSLFLNMLGVDSITAPASSGATERVLNLEISLVLDVSGSMGGTRINNLRPAAQQFVSNMITGREDLVSISIVPYNGKVNIGSTMATYYDLSTAEHELSNCARFSTADFSTTEITAGTVLNRIGNFDTNTDDLDHTSGGIANPYCPHDNTNAIIPHSNSVGALQTFIGNLNAGGWTAIDTGAKWGVALLDPSARSRVTEMIDDDVVEEVFRGRPYDYGEEDVMKIMVIMTDGANTRQEDLRDDRRGSGLSPIYAYHPSFNSTGGTRTTAINNQIMADASNTRYTVYFPEMGEFYDWARDDRRNDPVGGGDAIQLTWNEVNSIFAIDYLQDQIVWRSATRTWDGGSRYRNGGYAEGVWIPEDDYNFWRRENDYIYSNTGSADTNLSTLCADARLEGIITYSIAFQAQAGGETAMRDCAFDEAFYIEVDGPEIGPAFDQIESSINSLKLTQ